ncbi:error-prone DNA polymerase [Corynebacterium alimapuense]|uniref:Error-prone DNA polymerase n=1 Tax=Corynebacterium alimapuense TaxID=1576874 RepID=A0A3M8K6G3_9CORY|nr:error-prone DNA polymerase [Corynebacterium alimapuense]RNE48817.1 error-prone DNA polymerase [Corynebacterium alimapuense]
MEFQGAQPLKWSRLADILSGKPGLSPVSVDHLPTPGLALPQARKDGCFAELHAVSSYSFLSGASEPEAMVHRAVELGLPALALVDRDGFYGAVRFAESAAAYDLPTVFGAELSWGQRILTVLARGPNGYRRLSGLIARARLAAGAKGEVRYPDLAGVAHDLADSCLIVLGHDWIDDIDEMLEIFGEKALVLEYAVTMTPEDADHHERLDHYPHLRAIVTALPKAATREHARLAALKSALAVKKSLSQASAQLHPMGAPWLRSGQQISRMLPGREKLLAETIAIAEECAFTLDLLAPGLPDFPTPAGHTEMTWLRELTLSRAGRRYASRGAELWEQAASQIEHELAVISQLNFPGYFLIVNDLVEFCKRRNILCQGRGSAASSVVCFCLGITNVEPISAGLLFERFLSAERDVPPDIDIDIESGRREEVIAYVYDTHGRERAAQVANVITYRSKGAIRDAARALGYPTGHIDAWSRGTTPPSAVIELAEQLKGQPRHLGIHSSGMVICDRPLSDVVPVEWARKVGRTVLQWDKDDCAWAGLVKFDLLGLGMLEALHHMIDLVAQQHGRTINLWELDLAEPEVYDMLCRADAIGVFQVESRAQLATLPRLKPRVFFDLVVEVALIRPGPIQGGSVHPYLKRRDGSEKIVYDHPVLRPALEKTLGIPLFQEQLMQIAVDAAGFSSAEADSLRRAMGSKRSPAKMAELKERFLSGARELNDITGERAETLWNKIVAFAAYGFPESHAQSFASLVYFSAWFKYHYPAEFCVGLLRAQPMGFYSPQSLIQDARRHGVVVLPVSVNDSGASAQITEGKIRLGLEVVAGLGLAAAGRIEEAAPFKDIADLSRRAGVNLAQVEALARAGALGDFGLERRQALWQSGVAATEQLGMLPGLSAIAAPPLPGMSELELIAADIAATGITPQRQPMELLREQLKQAGVLSAASLTEVPDGTRIRVAGVITHRQRPATASGLTFLGMEDESGLINVVVSVGLWQRHRVLAQSAKALVVRGIVHNATGSVSVQADRFEPLTSGGFLSRGSRDFR